MREPWESTPYDDDSFIRDLAATNRARRDTEFAAVEQAQQETGPEESNGWEVGDLGEPIWPPMEAVPELPKVPSLPADMVPEPLRPWLVGAATRACLPLEMLAAPALVGVAAVVGRGVGIKPERYDNVSMTPNLWGACVAPPGWLKSHAMSESLRPIRRLVVAAADRYQTEAEQVAQRRIEIEALLASLNNSIKGTKDPDRRADLAQQIANTKKELGECRAVERRYMTQDATIEKLGEILRDNPRGILIARDEIAGWMHSMERPGREGDRELYLEAWNGTGSYTTDRIGRGTIHIPALTLSVVGGIQPGKLEAYVNEAMRGSIGADGLMQRVQLLVWPDSIGQWVRPTTHPDMEPCKRACEIVARLDDIADILQAIGAQQGEYDEIPWVGFAGGAQAVWDKWRDELEQRLRGRELDTMPAFASHIAKYRSLMASLALLFHLLDVADGRAGGPVSEHATRLAADWCDYLEAHARKVYAAETSPGIGGAKALAAKIETGAIPDATPLRDIYRRQWSELRTPDAVIAAIRRLEDASWCRTETKGIGGQASEVLRIHPSLRGGAA